MSPHKPLGQTYTTEYSTLRTEKRCHEPWAWLSRTQNFHSIHMHSLFSITLIDCVVNLFLYVKFHHFYPLEYVHFSTLIYVLHFGKWLRKKSDNHSKWSNLIKSCARVRRYIRSLRTVNMVIKHFNRISLCRTRVRMNVCGFDSVEFETKTYSVKLINYTWFAIVIASNGELAHTHQISMEWIVKENEISCLSITVFIFNSVYSPGLSSIWCNILRICSFKSAHTNQLYIIQDPHEEIH